MEAKEKFEKLPKELKEKGLFCLWESIQKEDGKISKKPLARTNHEEDFQSFDKVKNNNKIGIEIFHSFCG